MLGTLVLAQRGYGTDLGNKAVQSAKQTGFFQCTALLYFFAVMTALHSFNAVAILRNAAVCCSESRKAKLLLLDAVAFGLWLTSICTLCAFRCMSFCKFSKNGCMLDSETIG